MNVLRTMSDREMIEAENLSLRAALAYARRNWHVFPLHTALEGGKCSCRNTACGDVGKHPRTQHGYKDATTDEALIRRWWGMWPEANVGIACGASGLVVLDVDPRHGGDESLADLGTAWLETPTVLTGGGGAHYYYQALPGQPVRNQVDFRPGIDIRGADGYVVAPPSRHASARVYVWERTVNDVPLQPWPAAFTSGPVRRFDAHRAGAGTAPAVINSGERNAVLTSLAGTMRHRGFGAEAIFQALRVENSARCQPPLPERDLRRIAESVGSYAPGDDAVEHVRAVKATYRHLTKLQTEPPSYVLRVNEQDVRVSIGELSEFKSLQRAISSTADFWPYAMKQLEWEDQLRALMQEMNIVEAPDEASEAGVIWATICECLLDREDDMESLLTGRVVQVDSRVLVRGRDLRQGLKAHGLVLSDPRKMWTAISAHGGVNHMVRVGEGSVRVYDIPTSELSE